jgi:hypothetical protein
MEKIVSNLNSTIPDIVQSVNPLERVWSGLIASPLDNNAQFGHYIALVRLLCLHGGKERQKFVCPFYIVLEILEYTRVIL